MAYTLPTLSYNHDALEPFIDTQTMEIHHTKHHQTYVNNLNDTIVAHDISDAPVETLISDISSLPESAQTAVRNNGGGHANHSLFWTILSDDRTQPSDKLSMAINNAFGSYDAFVETFTTAAKGRFGSGWAWLTLGTDGQLLIESSANQDNPLMGSYAGLSGGTPILGLDVWEHAYYLSYQNRRPDYIAGFFAAINWNEVERRYVAALT